MAAHCSGCVFTVCVCSLLCVCTLDGINAEHKFRAWVTILGRMSLHFHFTNVMYVIWQLVVKMGTAVQNSESSPQTWCSLGLTDWGHSTRMSAIDNGRRRALHCRLMSWFIHILIFLWAFRSGRICHLWLSPFSGFHDCNTLCLPATGNPGWQNTIG